MTWIHTGVCYWKVCQCCQSLEVCLTDIGRCSSCWPTEVEACGILQCCQVLETCWQTTQFTLLLLTSYNGFITTLDNLTWINAHTILQFYSSLWLGWFSVWGKAVYRQMRWATQQPKSLKLQYLMMDTDIILHLWNFNSTVNTATRLLQVGQPRNQTKNIQTSSKTHPVFYML